VLFPLFLSFSFFLFPVFFLASLSCRLSLLVSFLFFFFPPFFPLVPFFGLFFFFLVCCLFRGLFFPFIPLFFSYPPCFSFFCFCFLCFYMELCGLFCFCKTWSKTFFSLLSSCTSYFYFSFFFCPRRLFSSFFPMPSRSQSLDGSPPRMERVKVCSPALALELPKTQGINNPADSVFFRVCWLENIFFVAATKLN